MLSLGVVRFLILCIMICQHWPSHSFRLNACTVYIVVISNWCIPFPFAVVQNQGEISFTLQACVVGAKEVKHVLKVTIHCDIISLFFVPLTTNISCYLCNALKKFIVVCESFKPWNATTWIKPMNIAHLNASLHTSCCSESHPIVRKIMVAWIIIANNSWLLSDCSIFFIPW